MPCMSAFPRLLVVTSALFAFSVPVLAQQSGSVGGKIVDPAGLALPGATVTITEQNTGFARTVVTAETGAYTVPSLAPGV